MAPRLPRTPRPPSKQGASCAHAHRILGCVEGRGSNLACGCGCGFWAAVTRFAEVEARAWGLSKYLRFPFWFPELTILSGRVVLEWGAGLTCGLADGSIILFPKTSIGSLTSK